MSTKQKKTIQKGSFKRLLKLFFFKNKMLTALMLFSIVISAVATALGPQYLGYATDSIVQDMSNPVSSNILICPLSSRQVKYLKVSDKNTYISFWSVGIFMHTISLYIF